MKETKNQKVFIGDNAEILKTFPDNFFDSFVTDPPYGLGKEPDAVEMLKAWIETGYLEVKGTGFMGRKWDSFVPQPNFWKEVFRVLKPGGHVLSFFGTRTYDWGVIAMRIAGFEIRDSIQWVYGNGFPKSHNISIAMDKMNNSLKVVGKGNEGKTALGQSSGYNKTNNPHEFNITEPNSEEAKKWSGWGSALKPAHEPIVVARKPLEKGLSIAENVLKWGVGGINIDISRIAVNPAIDDMKREVNRNVRNKDSDWSKNSGFKNETNQFTGVPESGRFPTNYILTHHPECECVGYMKVKGSSCKPQDIGKGREGNHTNGIYGAKASKITTSYNDENGKELVEKWNCHAACPIKQMDEQSGISKYSDTKRTRNTIGSFGTPNDNTNEYSDQGGASRFFYVAKPSKSEKNFGLGNEINDHPTVKPMKLIQYLVRLVTPEGGKVCDPFSGSGTTGKVCKIDGFECYLMEQDEEQAIKSQKAIDSFVEEKKLLEECVIFESIKETNDNQLNLFDNF